MEKIHDLHSSPNVIPVIQSKKTKCEGHVIHRLCVVEERCTQGSVGTPEGKKPECKWKDNI